MGGIIPECPGDFVGIRRSMPPARCIEHLRLPKPVASCAGHFTPKHASWLNMVECEISVLQRQCLGRRIDDAKRLRKQMHHKPPH